VLAAVTVFKQLGAKIREVDMRGMEETARLAADITAGEALAYHHDWLRRRSRDYGEDVRSRLDQSRRLTALTYIQAMQKRTAYSGRMEQVLNLVDMLLTPTLPVVAPGIGQEQVSTGRAHRDVRLALLSLTRPANLSGLPAISLPCGFSPDGLPVGLQLIGRRFEDATLLCAAYAYEQATSWHRQFPEDPV
jgi:aspartyl-tRNA(Asn)/glutamyl-tRNA(Gln) amidotransferase subunit A